MLCDRNPKIPVAVDLPKRLERAVQKIRQTHLAAIADLNKGARAANSFSTPTSY